MVGFLFCDDVVGEVVEVVDFDFDVVVGMYVDVFFGGVGDQYVVGVQGYEFVDFGDQLWDVVYQVGGVVVLVQFVVDVQFQFQCMGIGDFLCWYQLWIEWVEVVVVFGFYCWMVVVVFWQVEFVDDYVVGDMCYGFFFFYLVGVVSDYYVQCWVWLQVFDVVWEEYWGVVFVVGIWCFDE